MSFKFIFISTLFLIITNSPTQSIHFVTIDENGRPNIEEIPDYSMFRNKDLARFSPSYHISDSLRLISNLDIKIIKSKGIEPFSDTQVEGALNYLMQHTIFLKHKNRDNNLLCAGFFIEKDIMITASHCLTLNFLEGAVNSINRVKIICLRDNQEYDCIQDLVEQYFWQILPKSIDFELHDFIGIVTPICNGLNWYKNDVSIIKLEDFQTSFLTYKEDIQIGDVIILIGIVPDLSEYKGNDLRNAGINVSEYSEIYSFFGNPGRYYLSLGKITYIDEVSVCYDAPNLMGTSGGPVVVVSNASSNNLEFIAIHVGGGRDFQNSCGLRHFFIKQELEKSFFQQNFILICATLWDITILRVSAILMFKALKLKIGRKNFILNLLFGIFLAWALTKLLTHFGLILAMDLLLKRLLGF